jgi:hypothetical protein
MKFVFLMCVGCGLVIHGWPVVGILVTLCAVAALE